MPGKGRPPQAIPSPISRHIITCYARYQGSKHTVIYILVQTIISVQAKLEVVRRKHIVHLTGFGAYSSTCYKGTDSKVFCTSGPNFVVLAWTGDELSHGQAQNGVNFDFEVKFDLEGQGQSPPKTIEILTKVFYIYGPNLVILAETGHELSRGQAKGWRTHTQTDADNDNTRRPKLASGKKATSWNTQGFPLIRYAYALVWLRLFANRITKFLFKLWRKICIMMVHALIT